MCMCVCLHEVYNVIWNILHNTLNAVLTCSLTYPFFLQSVNREMKVKALNGKEYYLVDVIAHILKFLKDALITHLNEAGIGFQATDFDWVITVPAIWRARGKQMMREAGYKVYRAVQCVLDWSNKKLHKYYCKLQSCIIMMELPYIHRLVFAPRSLAPHYKKHLTIYLGVWKKSTQTSCLLHLSQIVLQYSANTWPNNTPHSHLPPTSL